MASRRATVWHPAGRRNAVFMSSDPAPRSRCRIAARCAAARRCEPWAACSLGLFGASWLALFVGWLSLHWLILPHIEEWRRPIEARASRLLGAVVKIGAIEVRSSGWVPALELRDVQVLDAEQRVALSLPRVAASLSPRSLLALEPRFEQLLIDGAGARHPARRGRPHPRRRARLRRQGLGRRRRRRRRRLVLQAARVRDPRRHGALDRRAAAGAAAGADRRRRWWCATACARTTSASTPPRRRTGAIASAIRGRFSQPLFARAGDWRRWSGSMFSDLPRADVRELRRYVTLPFELSEGDGALRGWFEVHEGQPEAATVDVALRAVALRLDKSVEALEFEQVEGRFDARRKGDRIAVEARGFGFVTGDGIRWPQGRPERRLGAAGRRGRDQRRVLRRAARHRRDGRHRRPRAARRGAARAARRRPSRGRDHPAQHPLGRADRRAGALPGQGQAERPVARPPTPASEHDAVGRPGLRNADRAARCERGRRRGADRPGAGRGRAARRVRRAGAAVRPARRQAGMEDRAASPAPQPNVTVRGARGALRQRRCRRRAERDLAHRRRRGHGARRALSGPARARRQDRQRPRRPHGALPAARPARFGAQLRRPARSSTARSIGPRSASAATSGTSRSTAASRAAKASSGSRPRSRIWSFAYIPDEAPASRAGRSGQLRTGRRSRPFPAS